MAVKPFSGGTLCIFTLVVTFKITKLCFDKHSIHSSGYLGSFRSPLVHIPAIDSLGVLAVRHGAEPNPWTKSVHWGVSGKRHSVTESFDSHYIYLLRAIHNVERKISRSLLTRSLLHVISAAWRSGTNLL
jgi:hypothetical protein